MRISKLALKKRMVCIAGILLFIALALVPVSDGAVIADGCELLECLPQKTAGCVLTKVEGKIRIHHFCEFSFYLALNYYMSCCCIGVTSFASQNLPICQCI